MKLYQHFTNRMLLQSQYVGLHVRDCRLAYRKNLSMADVNSSRIGKPLSRSSGVKINDCQDASSSFRYFLARNEIFIALSSPRFE